MVPLKPAFTPISIPQSIFNLFTVKANIQVTIQKIVIEEGNLQAYGKHLSQRDSFRKYSESIESNKETPQDMNTS